LICKGGNKLDENMQRARDLINALVQTNRDRFINYGGYLSPEWWLLLAFLIVPWLIWAKIVDKKRKLEIVVVGLFVAIVTSLLDVVGYNLGFWDYPIQLIPVVPEGFSFDLSMVPVVYMLLYQYFKMWKSYCIGLVCMSLIYAFIGEPFCNWIMVVVYIKWKYIYSAVYYIVIGITIRVIVDNLKERQEVISSSPTQ
jgi:hypothetical protein